MKYEKKINFRKKQKDQKRQYGKTGKVTAIYLARNELYGNQKWNASVFENIRKNLFPFSDFIKCWYYGPPFNSFAYRLRKGELVNVT